MSESYGFDDFLQVRILWTDACCFYLSFLKSDYLAYFFVYAPYILWIFRVKKSSIFLKFFDTHTHPSQEKN